MQMKGKCVGQDFPLFFTPLTEQSIFKCLENGNIEINSYDNSLIWITL